MAGTRRPARQDPSEQLGREFEDEVRRVARALWPSARYSGAEIVDGRERDGVFDTEWVTHLVECTTDRTKAKAEKDIPKLLAHRAQLARDKSRHGKPVQCWWITKHEPEAHQRMVAPKDGSVRVMSFHDFLAQLVDCFAYIRDRDNYPFGSARDPETGQYRVQDRYVAMPLHVLGDQSQDLKAVTLRDWIQSGKRVVLVGEYGTGKSMTLREIYHLLTKDLRNGASRRFAIHLNLRDHHGQSDPSEALHRHAVRIGFPNSNDLVRAWRAGNAHLLLDGFDELASLGRTGTRLRMRETRRAAMELIRNFVREAAPGTGVLVAGRHHYFDSTAELVGSLAVSDFMIAEIGQFSAEQIANYLKAKGWDGGIPAWMPTRPLLLGYLAARAVLPRAIELGQHLAPAAAWHELLSLICAREAEIESNIDGTTLRAVVERIASLARERSDAVGPIEFADIEAAFIGACGYEPDDRALVLLQRLPGLGPASEQDGTRQFIDAELAECASAGDLVRYAISPFGPLAKQLMRQWYAQLSQLGIDVLTHQLTASGLETAQISVAVKQASNSSDGSSMALDLTRALLEMGGRLDLPRPAVVSELVLEDLRLDTPSSDVSSLHIEDSVIGRLEFPRDGMDSGSIPTFARCHFGVIEGRSGPTDLPRDRILEDCSFDSFSEEGITTDRLLAASLPVGERVALTILKKLYAQRGSARREGALYRGLGAMERTLVTDVLAVLQREGLALKTRVGSQVLWHPDRSATGRVYAMLSAPSESGDPILQMLSDLAP